MLSVELPRSSCSCNFCLVCAFMMWLQKRSNCTNPLSVSKHFLPSKGKLQYQTYQTECTWTNSEKNSYIYGFLRPIHKSHPSMKHIHHNHFHYFCTFSPTIYKICLKKLDIFFLIRITNNSSIQAKARHLKTESAPNARKPSIVLQLLGS